MVQKMQASFEQKNGERNMVNDVHGKVNFEKYLWNALLRELL